MKTLSIEEARRIAIAAQGLAEKRPAKPTRKHLQRVIEHLGLLQLDFVNVVVPAHYLVPFSRLGPYKQADLHEVAYRSGAFTEQWAHEACIVPVHAWPLLEYRRAAHRVRPYSTDIRKHREYADRVLEEVRARGPLSAADLEGATGDGRLPGTWYRSQQRVMLEAHFGRGALAVKDRLPNFARVFDLPERAIPQEHRERELAHDEARYRLLQHAARAHGVATVSDVADYYRMRPSEAKPLFKRLLDEAEVREVKVEGWREPAYLHRDARAPKRVDGQAILSPFDPLIWFRPRVARLFHFEYKIEIYTPAAKRRWGYYVLPFLLGDRLVARVDLKADRAAGVLRALSVHYEKNVDRPTTREALRAELTQVATWLGLPEVSGRL